MNLDPFQTHDHHGHVYDVIHENVAIDAPTVVTLVPRETGYAISMEGKDGIYRPAIPYPMFVGWRLRKKRCDCGDVFKTMLGYREHYAYAHICGY